MENRYALFRVALVLNILILVVSFTGVISAPMQYPMSITEVMKSDNDLCETSKFLYDSEYTKLCASLSYPSNASLHFTEENLNIFLCLGVYDTAYKICQYSSQLSPQIPRFNITELTSYVKNITTYVKEFVPKAREIPPQQKEFCDNLQGFTSSYNKTDSLLKPLIENLNSYKCQPICFAFEGEFRPLCAVFAWIKRFDDIKKAERTETKHIDKLDIILKSNETASNNKIDAAKKTPAEENNEKNMNKFTENPENDNKVEEVTSYGLTEIVPTVYVESDVEKVKPDAEKSSEAQKKSNNTQAHPYKLESSTFKENEKNTIDIKSGIVKIGKPMNTLTNDDLQISSINNSADDVPKKDVVNKEKGEEINKEQNTDDLKTSTLSENTQDHYDVGNPEEDIEPNVADSNNGI